MQIRYDLVMSIINEDLGIRCVSSKFVLKPLSVVQCSTWYSAAQDSFDSLEKDEIFS